MTTSRFGTICFVAVVFLMSNAPLAQCQSLKPGKIHSGIAPKADPTQTYSIYLPSKYSAKKSWPVLFGFSPSANGRSVVEKHKQAAERFGWIIVASEVSKNGPMTVSKRAGETMWADVNDRFKIDHQRLYAAGLSGGAIAASYFAENRDTQFAGVFLHARGDFGSIPKKETKTFFFLIPGDNDFNLGESVRFTCLGRKTKSTIHLAIQSGGHAWASNDTCIGLLRYAELRQRLTKNKKPDTKTAKLLAEEFNSLAAELDGPYFLCAWLRLEELALKSHKSVKFLRQFEKLERTHKDRLVLENQAWEQMAKECLFDAEFEKRMPSIKSVKAVDIARRQLAAQHSGTTAVQLILLSQKNAPASFNRAIPRIPDAGVKKAYQDYLSGLRNVGIDFIEEARKLIKKKKPNMAIVALHHGATIGQVERKTLKRSAFKSLKRKPGFKRLGEKIQ